MSDEVRIALGSHWALQLRAATGVSAVFSAQRRLTGHIETMLLIAETEAHNGALGERAVVALAENHAVSVDGYEPSFELEGQGSRAPRSSKRAARATWYRQLFSHHPRSLTVTIPDVLPAKRVRLPDDLPIESTIPGGATSGILRAGSVSLLRVSTTARETEPRDPFSPVSVSDEAKVLTALYANGPLGWMDTIMCFDGSNDVLAVRLGDR